MAGWLWLVADCGMLAGWLRRRGCEVVPYCTGTVVVFLGAEVTINSPTRHSKSAEPKLFGKPKTLKQGNGDLPDHPTT